MTTYNEITVKCNNCGKIYEILVLMSYNSNSGTLLDNPEECPRWEIIDYEFPIKDREWNLNSLGRNLQRLNSYSQIFYVTDYCIYHAIKSNFIFYLTLPDP